MLRGGVLAFSVGRDGGCTLERVAGMEMVGATGGASKARMPEMNAQRLCMDAKPTKRSFKGKGDSAKQGIVRFWKVMRGEGVCDNNIKKRSQLAAVTVYLLYWFV